MTDNLNEKKQQVKKIIAKLRELFPDVKSALNYTTTWEFVVAAILSAQTTDKQVNKVTETLFKKYASVNDYAKAEPEEFRISIKSINYYNTKAKNIQNSARLIVEKYNGEVPATMTQLLELPGVGRKVANVIIGNVFGTPEGIAVDTHVRRITKLLGLTKNTDPAKIEKDLMLIVPKEEWTAFTHLMIEYGRKYCSARAHDHSNCPLSLSKSGIISGL